MKIFLIHLGLLLTINSAAAQVTTTITLGAKKVYEIGDIVNLTIVVNAPEETCTDGLDRIKLFQSGIEIKKQSNWKEIKKGYWQKEVSLVITGSKKKYGMLTIMRRTDKQSFTYQERFEYSI